MKQYEADLIAKSIRNAPISLEGKKEITEMITREMLKYDQFFNVNRFQNVAINELDVGWPNRMDPKK